MRRVLELFGMTAALAAVGGCACARGGGRVEVAQANTVNECYGDPSLIGPRGADGPAGPEGARGPTGQTGAPGYAMAGPRGAPGEMGYTGEQGPTGATGPSGFLVRGRAGVAGPTGPQGETGAIGQTGVRGESAAGFAGPDGARGPTGPQGATGATGIRGATLEGPTGPAGYAGAAGTRGETGNTGDQGRTMLGVAGPAGPSGALGSKGSTGEVGAQGGAGDVSCWTAYREFWFPYGSSEMLSSETGKPTEIAVYLRQNPSLQVGIDGTMDPRGTDPKDQNLDDRRVSTVRNALIASGVPSHKIKIGAFGDPELRRDRRIEVLFTSAN